MIWDAYRRTTYRIFAPEGAIDVRVGAPPPSLLRAVLDRHGATAWAFVTAWNPQSRPLSRDENDRRQQLLLAEADRRGWPTLRGLGIGDDERWTPEDSVLVLGIGREEARELARRFGQLAIVYGTRDEPAELVAVDDARKGDSPLSG